MSSVCPVNAEAEADMVNTRLSVPDVPAGHLHPHMALVTIPATDWATATGVTKV